MAEQRAYQASIQYQKAELVALQVSNQLSDYQSTEQSYDACKGLVLSSQITTAACLRYNGDLSLDLMDAQAPVFSGKII